MPYAAIVDWFGPYKSTAELRDAADELGVLLKHNLYMAIGSRPRQKNVDIQYVGISRSIWTRFDKKHPINSLLKKQSLKLFLGIVSSQSVSGRKASHHHKGFSIPVTLSESILAFLLELPLNKDKRCSTPVDSITLVNRWFKTNLDDRYRNRPHPNWPDYLEYDWETDDAKIVWFGGKQRTFRRDDINDIIARARVAKAKQKASKTSNEEKLLEEALSDADRETLPAPEHPGKDRKAD